MSAMPLAEAEDAFVIGDQQTSAVDSGRYEQPIRRVTLFEMTKLIAPGSHAMAERHSLNTGTRATEQYEYPVGARPSPLDLSTSFGLGRDIQGRRDQVYTLSNTDRSAVCPKQGTGASMLIQQKPHGHGNRFGLVSGSQLLGRLFDQGDDVGSIDSDNVHHVAPLFCRIITSLMIC